MSRLPTLFSLVQRPPATRRTARRSLAVTGLAVLVTWGAATPAGCAGPGNAVPSAGAAVQDTLRPAAPPGAPDSAFPAPERPVSDIVAPRWTDERVRDKDGEFARVVALALVQEGMQVADIGAGDGYYVARLAPLVGTTGRVYGQDIVPEYLALLDERVRRAGWRNVQVALGEAHDPRLPPATLDLAFMIHMYHEITQPFGVLWNLATAMKPGGRLVILDLDRRTDSHGTPPALLRCELEAVGYRQAGLTRTAPGEYVAIFEAPAQDARPTPAAIRARLQRSPCRGW
ncbi:MAG: methyltransferase domain-containing protein [Gemmatimonadetes bacterium]|nr:methyltransferase domain-containing protein [Gemmatimonadota bacterium]